MLHRTFRPGQARLSAAAVGVAALLSGCATVPDLGPAPRVATATSFAADRTLATAAPAAWPGSGWWASYGDAQLDALITEALASAPDLAIASARVRGAEAVARVERSALLPTLDTDASVGVAKQSYNAGIPAGVVPRGWKGTGALSTTAGFELDLWSGNRAAFAAARSEAEAARLDRAQAELLLSTNIADTYADLSRFFAERAVQTTALDVRQQTARLTSDRVGSGLVTQAELKQAIAAVSTARADLAATDEAIALTRNRLAALLGKGPDRGLSITAPRTQVTARGLPADVTTDLVGRRPDVVAARVRTEAAASRIKVARADFYPAVNLTAMFGLQALGLGNLIDSGSTFGSAGPALSLPIFRGGELRGRYSQARAEYDEAVARYDRTVTDAFREVADAVTSQRALAERLRQSEAALVDAEAAYAIAQQRYRGGLSTFLDQLTAQDRVLQALRSVSDLKVRAFTLDVALVRALGGGFAAPAASASNHTISKDTNNG